MQKSLEFTGKNEDAAIAAALEKLGLSREDVSVEVLELAKPGFLGIGGTPAKVKVTFEAPDEPEEIPAPVAEEKPAPTAEKKAAPAVEEKDEESIPVRTSGNYTAAPAGDEKAQRIVEFLTGLLEHMEVEAVPQVSLDEEGNYLVELEGKGLGQVIGHRGETLDAIQQLTGYAVNKGESKRCRIRIDAEGYRAKREESLEKMANRVADKVLRLRRNMTLEPMNAYERHVIHTALQGREDITTYSIGAEPNRRTVVAYSPGENR
ncbi:MAG: protein jag [Oscillospiraceae bacterium]|nr:protein jag [Oscillospiraceae bacterium]